MNRLLLLLIPLTAFGVFKIAAQNETSFNGFQLVDKSGNIRKPADVRDAYQALGAYTVLDPKGNCLKRMLPTSRSQPTTRRTAWAAIFRRRRLTGFTYRDIRF